MFNNLIESSSHRIEMKRRGLFFVFTTASYALLFAIAGVASIYAYDLKLEERNLEVIAQLSPLDFAQPQRAPRELMPVGSHNTGATNRLNDIRRNPTADLNQPNLAPEKISTTPNPELPVRGPHKIGSQDLNASVSGGQRGPGGSGPPTTAVPVVEVITPPPAPTPKPAPRIIKSTEILNGKALRLPKPVYSQIARSIGLRGSVNVQVLIDESGRVVSAKALDGPSLLRPACERAAYEALFSPTILNQQPVKVSGLITYNFVVQ